jgi:hypothetical protein
MEEQRRRFSFPSAHSDPVLGALFEAREKKGLGQQLEGLYGMENLGQAQAKLQGIHREADEFLSYIVRSFKLDWQAAFVQSMVDLVLEMQNVSAHIARLMQNFEHYILFSVRRNNGLPSLLSFGLFPSIHLPPQPLIVGPATGAASTERGDQLPRLLGGPPSRYATPLVVYRKCACRACRVVLCLALLN